LVGDFEVASRHLTSLFSRLYRRRIIALSPRALIQARERNEGGLSPVEERVLLELASAAGASEAYVHDGLELSDFAARDLLAKRSRDA
jgi:rod shape-determining protein MreB